MAITEKQNFEILRRKFHFFVKVELTIHTNNVNMIDRRKERETGKSEFIYTYEQMATAVLF
jgi:hypothetical protein